MWHCRKCSKPVYFAERKTSLGYNWHPECLRCEECGKRLNPGQHAEHKGVPYCHIPCYSVLFGPTLFGHGSQVEAHTSFGKIECRQGTPVSSAHLEAKLRLYNMHHEGKSSAIQSRERNGRLILEGSLRIYWGVNNVIRLKEDHDNRILIRRRSFHYTKLKGDHLSVPQEKDLSVIPSSRHRSPLENGSDLNKFSDFDLDYLSDAVKNYRTLPNIYTRDDQSDEDDDETNGEADLHNIILDGDLENVPLRRDHRGRARNKLKRRCSINGHFYNRETSIFMPAYESVTSVWATSLINTPEVINILLDKFKVENNPEDFALFVVRDNGERRMLHDHEYPLIVRVMLGPNEDVAKIFIMNKKRTTEISHEVAQYLLFSDVELKTFLQKFCEEEEMEVGKVKRKYGEMKRLIRYRMNELKAAEMNSKF